MNQDLASHYHLQLAVACARGKLGHQLTGGLGAKPLADLTFNECETLFRAGQAAGLKMHRFKRSAALPRIQKVLGILKSLHPANLLDIGTGRGVFLWPLLDAFHGLPVVCIDLLDYRIAEIAAATIGGIDHLRALRADAARLPFRDRAFDGICLLETLEHVGHPQAVIDEVCRVAGRFVVLSVPSKPDNNPDHRHLFDADRLRRLFDAAGGFEARIDFVLNHIVALAMRM